MQGCALLMTAQCVCMLCLWVWLLLCVCVCIGMHYVCVRVCVCAYIYYVCAVLCVFAYILYACMFLCVRVCVYACVRERVCVCVCTCVTCVHRYVLGNYCWYMCVCIWQGVPPQLRHCCMECCNCRRRLNAWGQYRCGTASECNSGNNCGFFERKSETKQNKQNKKREKEAEENEKQVLCGCMFLNWNKNNYEDRFGGFFVVVLGHNHTWLLSKHRLFENRYMGACTHAYTHTHTQTHISACTYMDIQRETETIHYESKLTRA